MHEASLARQILAIVLQHARDKDAVRVRAVHAHVAETETLSRDSLAFHFAAHARGTPAAGAHLDIRIIHVEAQCHDCGHTYAPESHLILCPSCGSTEADLLGDTGVGVETIEVE